MRATAGLFFLSLSRSTSLPHPLSCGTCAIAACLPCGLAVLHGRSTRRFLGTTDGNNSAWWTAHPALSFALLTAGAWLLRTPFVIRTESACYPLDVHAPSVPASLAAACARGRAIEAITWWVAAVLTLAGLGLAASRRVAARRRFGLGGSGGRLPRAVLLASDVLAWICCPACAACQEARTAAAACEGGEWVKGEVGRRRRSAPGEEEDEEEGGGVVGAAASLPVAPPSRA